MRDTEGNCPGSMIHNDRHDSVIPWNKQESWETQGQFAGMTDRR